MAFWGDRDGFVDKDLMGVPGDTLFADPLGVRPSSRNQVPNRSQAPYGGASQSQYRERRDDVYSRAREEEIRYTPGMSPKSSDGSRGVRKQEEEEEGQWGPLGSLLWYVVAGGKQCCTMRDRTKPQDAAASKRASEEGRPPEFARSQNSRFPGPFESDNAFEGHGRRDADLPFEGRGFGREGNRDRNVGHGDDRGFGGANRDDRDRGLGRGGAGGRGFDTGNDPGDRGRTLGGDDRGRGLGRETDYGLGRTREFDSGLAGSRLGAEREAAKPPQRLEETPQRDAKKEAKPETRQAERPSIPAPAGIKPSDAAKKEKGGELPKQWSWPSWCLNFKSPCIEVYVVDEDTGDGRWVEGEPQSRVVDNAGKDAYLCVEYEWDGEFYVQDFGPQHIRRRGQTKTVAELLG